MLVVRIKCVGQNLIISKNKITTTTGRSKHWEAGGIATQCIINSERQVKQTGGNNKQSTARAGERVSQTERRLNICASQSNTNMLIFIFAPVVILCAFVASGSLSDCSHIRLEILSSSIMDAMCRLARFFQFRLQRIILVQACRVLITSSLCTHHTYAASGSAAMTRHKACCWLLAGCRCPQLIFRCPNQLFSFLLFSSLTFLPVSVNDAYQWS